MKDIQQVAMTMEKNIKYGQHKYYVIVMLQKYLSTNCCMLMLGNQFT